MIVEYVLVVKNKAMNLIIVESPTKAKTLSKFLGEGYIVEATRGHIKDLPKSPISVEVENNFKPDYQVVERQVDTIKTIKKAAENADSIFLATDPDREGEAIAQHVKDVLEETNNKKQETNIRRITFHEITKAAVEEAIAHPGKVNIDLVEAQIARRVLDRLVGYKLSPILWKKVRRGLSAGRVQTVTVRLIVEREREVEAFIPQEYWEIGSKVKGEEGEPFVVALSKIDGEKAAVNNGEQAAQIVSDLKVAEHIVSDIVRREVKKSPYPPFTTSTMTIASANLFGWSAKRTMSVAQKLYEQGLITYHRTDSLNLSVGAVDAARKYIRDTFGSEYLPVDVRRYKTHSKGAQEAHEAIRPTNVEVTSNKLQETNGELDAAAKKLYQLIWSRFVACQMSASVYDGTTIIVNAFRDAQSKHYELRVSGQVVKFDGWRKIIPNGKSDEPIIPSVKTREKLELLEVLSEQKFTTPPARYNEASIIKTLEFLGIGRPSTYAPTISTIQLRNYVEKKEGRFYPTPIGTSVVNFLVKNFPDTFEYEFTANMEGNLDKVALGEIDWHEDIRKFWEPFSKLLTDVEKNAERVSIPTEKLGIPCPRCELDEVPQEEKGELVIRVGRFGKFISCSMFPDCEYTDRYVEKIDMKCPKCIEDGLTLDKQGDVIVKKTKRGRTFYGCSRYPDCDFASWKKPVDPNKLVVEEEEVLE